MKESKEDRRYRKFHSVTPRNKFRGALFILKFRPNLKVDKVWSNRKEIYKQLKEAGCEWHVWKWDIGYHGGWVLSNKR